MHSTNYVNTFLAVAPDCPVLRGTMPPESSSPSVALRVFRMIHESPYRFTSDDVLFTVFADRKGIAEDRRAEARQLFFAKPQACLRASDLGKKYGWGVHADGASHLALYGMESPEYRAFTSGARLADDGSTIAVKHAMRSKR